jgi:hypothetical protein
MSVLIGSVGRQSCARDAGAAMNAATESGAGRDLSQSSPRGKCLGRAEVASRGANA